MTSKKKADEAREMTASLQDQAIDFGRPAIVTANPRGEPRELLRQFHFNYPFVGIIPITRPITVRFDGTAAIDIYLPDGTLAVVFSRTGNVIVSFDGGAADIATMTVNVATPGQIVNPPDNVGFFVYPNRRISARGVADAVLSVMPYISTDKSGTK